MNEPMERPSVVEAARDYLRRGWFPVPIPPREKGPVIKDWPALRLREDKLSQSFSPNHNIGLILGEASGWLVNVDLDCPEARELADQYLPATLGVSGRPSSPRCHRWYIAANAKTTQHRDSTTKTMIVELRSNGGQTVVGPSVHPTGELYDVLAGEPATVPAPMLAACVAALAQAVLRQRYGDQPPAESKPAPVLERRDYVGSDVDLERRAIAYLDALPPAIENHGGHSATFTAATAVVHGFGIAPERAFDLLKHHYNPRCDPEWSEKELWHKINQAVSTPHDLPFAWLRDAVRDKTAPDQPPVDISAIVAQTKKPTAMLTSRPAGPGPFPRHLLNVPGFIGAVMDYNLATAFKPQPILALGATLALLGTLTGRKIADHLGTRTNVYCLGVCRSGGGKERARQVNKEILFRAGLDRMAGPEGIASHAGLVAAVENQPSILFQLDEIGRMLKTLSDPSRAPHLFHIATVLMKLFNSSSTVYISDAYADVKRNKKIYQPHACLYGTTVPQSLYEGLSTENLTDGFYSRMMAFETDDDDPEPRDVSIADVPQSLVDTARFWDEFRPGGNLSREHPQPLVVGYTDAAHQIMADIEHRARDERQTRNDAAFSLWTRTTEKARKLALLYACSSSHEQPLVDETAAGWAAELSEYLTRKMITVAADWVAENPFEAKLKRLYRDIREAGEPGLTRSQLYRKTKHLNKKDRDELMERLLELEDIREVREPTKGAPRVSYTAF